MKAVPLPSRKVLLDLFSYDGEHLYWKNPPNRRNYLLGRMAETQHTKGYLTVGIEGKLYLVHRIIFKMKTGLEPEQVDHINRDRQDNRISNLRASTNAKNARNRINTRAPDLPRGVHIINSGRYRAIGCSKRKLIHLGVFDTERQAAQAVQSYLEKCA